jgi:hypothetical protein
MAFTQYNYISNHYNDTEAKPMNQQEWAEKGYGLIREKILPQAPADVIVSYGFPRAGKGNPSNSVGQCHTGSHITEAGKAAVIFIRPSEWKDPVTVLDTLTHEAVHAATPGDGHKSKFAALCKEVGLDKKDAKGKWKAKTASAGPELLQRLNAIAYEIGDFPAASFDYTDTKKQSTRLRLYECQCDPKEAKEEGRTTKIRCASDSMDITCNVCEAKFEMKEAKE